MCICISKFASIHSSAGKIIGSSSEKKIYLQPLITIWHSEIFLHYFHCHFWLLLDPRAPNGALEGRQFAYRWIALMMPFDLI